MENSDPLTEVHGSLKEKMNYATYIFLLTVTLLLMSLGLLLNAFIVIQNFIWWLKTQSLQTIDILLTSLGVVRILFIILYMAFSYSSNSAIVMPFHVLQYIVTVLTFVAFCSLWWGTVLCVFYCVKITNYSNRLFMRLKMNISRMVPWLLLTSLLVSFLCSLPCGWVVYSVRYINSTQVSNSSNDGNTTPKTNQRNLVITVFAGSFVPFLIFYAAVSTLIASLLKHARNMSSKDSAFTKSQLVAHKRTIINMTSFLFFYVLFLIGLNFTSFAFLKNNPLYRVLCSMCCILYPGLHSIMLVASNGNLKRSIVAVFCCARKWALSSQQT